MAISSDTLIGPLENHQVLQCKITKRVEIDINYFDKPRLSVFGFLVHVDVTHVNFDAQLFDAHPNGPARWRCGHIDELDTGRGETHLLPGVHNDDFVVSYPFLGCWFFFIHLLFEKKIISEKEENI